LKISPDDEGAGGMTEIVHWEAKVFKPWPAVRVMKKLIANLIPSIIVLFMADKVSIHRFED
jgi:hypothetical protein